MIYGSERGRDSRIFKERVGRKRIEMK